MSYDFNVPYIDFVNEFDENDGADTFFDVNCQLGKLSINEEKNNEKQNNSTPKIKEKGTEERKEELDARKTEKSHVETLVDADENQIESSEIREECKEDKDEKPCAGNKSVPIECKGGKVARKIRLKKTDMPDILSEISDTAQNIQNNKRKSDIAHGISKFISLAECVQKFQVATPPRFHSRPRGQIGATRKQYVMKQHVTIPQSPNLLSKNRSRPVDYPTAEEREKKEVEEVLSYKLEVHPVNPKIFEAPKCGKRVPKQAVAVEPFNLTEFKKKEVKKSHSPFHFKAQDVPKGILEHVTGVPAKKPIPVTNPTTPLVLSKHKQKLKFASCEMVDGKPVISSKEAHQTGVCMGKKNSKTEPKPFSFEERDKIMMKHKEEMIQKVYQEEKEAREFHAKPLPTYLKKINKTLDSTISSVRSTDNEEEKKPVFRAQPAAVLRRQPFVPKLSQRVLEPSPLLLATEERAKQRAEFDAVCELNRKEIEAELQRRKEMEEQRAREEEALLRQQTIHRAQPIRCYKAVPEALSAPITSPRSPCFSDRQTRNTSKK